MHCYEDMNQTLEIETVFLGKSSRVEVIGQYLLEQQNRLFVSRTGKSCFENNNSVAAKEEGPEEQKGPEEQEEQK